MNDVMLFMDKGGVIMYLILSASVIGLASAIYCALLMRRGLLLPEDLLKTADSSDPEQAIEACNRQGGPFAEIIMTVIDTRKSSRDEAEAMVEGAGRRAAHDLSKGPLALEVIAAVTPLLGLLGTVIGMSKAFGAISQSSAKNMDQLTTNIQEALYTTIFGLVVAIPAYVACTWFSRRVDTIVLEMERHAMALMGRVRNGEK